MRARCARGLQHSREPAIQHTDHTPKTTIPCPDWCTLPAGHGFDSFDSDGLLIRTHEQLGRDEVGVFLIAGETAATDEGPVLATVHRIEIDLAPVRRLTGPDVRQLAAALLNAADEWDRSTGEVS